MENRAAKLCLLHLLVLQEPSDLRFCLFRIDVIKPISLRSLFLAYLNLDTVAIVKQIAYRLHLTVHTGADAVTSNLGVHFKGKVKNRRANRKLFYFTLRRDDVHFVRFTFRRAFIVQRIEIRLVSRPEQSGETRESASQKGAKQQDTSGR